MDIIIGTPAPSQGKLTRHPCSKCEGTMEPTAWEHKGSGSSGTGYQCSLCKAFVGAVPPPGSTAIQPEIAPDPSQEKTSLKPCRACGALPSSKGLSIGRWLTDCREVHCPEKASVYAKTQAAAERIWNAGAGAEPEPPPEPAEHNPEEALCRAMVAAIDAAHAALKP